VSPVLGIDEVAVDPAFAARGLVAQGQHPTAGTLRQLAPPLAGAVRRTSYSLPDQSRTDTGAVLAAAGYPTEEIETLFEQGVVQ
jgi:crotonobetainyl-CoA:carnitine CoA-transferase CaiB-like acyl-CoA transferase